MKNCARKLVAALAMALVSNINYQISTVLAQGTAFTYQGQLQNDAAPASGTYNLTFTLFTNNVGGTAVAGPVTNSGVAVSNGLFTVTIDFGGTVWNGETNWLEIAVETNGSGAFTTLSPRQRVTPAPYAITAENLNGTVSSSGLSGTYGSMVTLNNPANQFTGGYAGNGAGLTNLNATTLSGLTSTNLWKVGGNAGANPTNGAFLGTTDNLPFELKVKGSRAFRLEFAQDTLGDNNPNVILGSSANIVSNGFYGGFVGGGGSTSYPNLVAGDFASVVGGVGNIATGPYSVAMGNRSAATAEGSFAVGASVATGIYSAALGSSTAEGSYSFAAGASGADGEKSIALGWQCVAAGTNSFAAGNLALANNNGSFVWADSSTSNYFQDTAFNQFLIKAAGGVGIGTSTPPPGGLNVATGGLAVSGASSPNYFNARGVFIENEGPYGVVYAYDYADSVPMPLCLNSPGGYVGINTTTPTSELDVIGNVTASLFLSTSDRNAKENFQPANAKDILEKVSALPLSRWNFKEDKSSEHLGPMAQDFYAAFKVGVDDKHIATVDEEGVALAAIQGLNQKLEEKDAEIADLKARLERLERLVVIKSESGH